MKKIKVLILLLLTALLLPACGKKDINIQEQMELGQKCLLEADYENAIVAFSKVIVIDPKNMEAGRSLAAAYKESGKVPQAVQAMTEVILQSERTETDIDFMNEMLRALEDLDFASTMTEVVYTQTGDDQFIKTLFVINGKRKDFEAIERTIQGLEMFRGMKDEYLEDIVQRFVDEKDVEGMDMLSNVLKEQDTCSGTLLAMDMWNCYMNGGEEAVVNLLETYYADDKRLPDIDPEGQMYIGSYDENGMYSGYGICLYGVDVKTHSRIYMGYWEKGDRNGEGRAYRSADYRIQCQWADDYPIGEINLLQQDTMVIGNLEFGHIVSPMNLYVNGRWEAVHCTPDQERDTGYSFQTIHMKKPSTCHHVENHSYCWDCKESEQGGNE
ncbi:hypothetical protein F220043C3_56760 [Enterocloster asparagiformis]|uniref:tetratricopeptide repeat protein n=1 Tax=Enterocloster asparagiformis TaxID=333367 RepID=UPI0034BAC3D2